MAVCLALLLAPSIAEERVLSTEAIFAAAGPAVVVIRTYDHKGLPGALGSGFILNPTGADTPAYLVTNFHVVKGAANATFRLGGKWVDAGAAFRIDPQQDLAIYQLARPATGLRLARAEAQVGQQVVVIGSPEGLENTVSEGIVSGIREVASRKLIQTTAPISHGSSGGPMLNRQGEVVAVMVSMLTEGQNLNFAIPAGEVRELLARQSSAASSAFGAEALWSDTVQRAWGLILQDRYRDAERLLSRHVASNPDDAEAWYKLGYVNSELGDQRAEIDCYRKAIRLYPENAEYWYDLGVAYGKLVRTRDAIEAYQEALRLNPDFAMAWYNLGVSYDKLGQNRNAIEAYREAIRIEPDYAKAWNNLGKAYGALDQNQNEIEAYREALRLNPDYAVAWYNLGVSYGKLGQRRDAIEAYREAIRLKPDYATAWCNLGVTYGELGQHREEMEAYREAIRLDPAFAMAWCNLGVIYGKLGQRRDAIEAFREAIRIDPDDAMAWYNLGISIATTDPSTARQCLLQLERLDPDLADDLRDFMYRWDGGGRGRQ